MIENADNQLAKAYNAIQQLAQQQTTTDDDRKKLNTLLDQIIKIDNKIFQIQLNLEQPNFYKVLNVSKGADNSEIRKKYFKLARKYHPDSLPADATEEQKEINSAKYQQVAEAYEVLSDPEKKKEYDQGRYNMDARGQKEAAHQQRQERTKQMLQGYGQQQMMGGAPFFGGGGQQFFFGDPFEMFQQMGFDFFGQGGQQQGQRGGQQQGQQGGQRRMKININGQEFYM